jgi:mono/diheme cytochrome c family protein
VAVRADDVSEPPAFDSTMVSHGFDHFRSMCVVCHGAPGVERGELGKGITPTPPELSEEAAEFTTRELFWITKHGIKMAGMPAFGTTHSDEEIWGLVAFLEELGGMSGEEYQRWESRFAASAPGGAEGGAEDGAGHSHAPGSAAHEH